jgi:hypothetical protein
MLIVTSTFVRPSVNIPFVPANHPSFVDNRENNYIQTGKILSRTVEDSADGLTRTIVTTWKTRAGFDEFRNDPVTIEFKTARREYFLANAISGSHEFEFLPTLDDVGESQSGPST